MRKAGSLRETRGRENCQRKPIESRGASVSNVNDISLLFARIALISRDKRVQPRDRCRCTRTLLPRRNIPAASSSQAFRPARRSKNSQTHVQMPHAISKICVLDIRDGNRRVEVKCQTNRQTGSETEKRGATQRYLRCTVVLISKWRKPNQR